MFSIIVGLLIPVLIVGGLVFIVVRRGFQMRLLVQDGVVTTGRVLAKLEYPTAKGSRGNNRRIHYSYQDEAGQTHEHRSLVTSDFWHGHTEGGPIDIVYARHQPHVSAPRHLVELSRQALAKKS